MNIKQYLHTLIVKRREGDKSPELARRIAYARAYIQGDAAIKSYRDRAIEREIGKTYTEGAQLAILFNKDTHPDEYAAYQAYRATCKAKVDAELVTLKTELLAALAL